MANRRDYREAVARALLLGLADHRDLPVRTELIADARLPGGPGAEPAACAHRKFPYGNGVSEVEGSLSRR
ncbi:hypothetical protein [Nocardia carnea]|uniref:Uncharacterized protein n=1 Tax=Nocardia carnea TaxID=37328 RepID=A0ABW7TRN1_9NOCA|nr:hypothetical protein [Nocardia carnea]